MTTPAHRAGKLQLELSEDQARTLVRALAEHESMIAGDPGDHSVSDLLTWVRQRARKRFGPGGQDNGGG